MPIGRSRQEVFTALEVQRSAITASCRAYDEGKHWEALRLAAATHIIVHDYGKTVSLLSQLGIKHTLIFVASGRPTNPKNLLREHPLIKTRVTNLGTGGVVGQFLPLLGDATYPYRLLQFSKWWETDLIFRDGKVGLTRKRLVFILRNKEGGGHFDPQIVEPDYERFARENITTPYVLAEGSQPKAILDAELATMRQAAWELATTLDWAKLN